MPAINSSSVILKSKQHFQILDGLRGIAAVAVVIFHFMEFAVPDYANNFIAHSYLAVDFFFCLSGFVIAYAYDAKIERIGILQFFKLRLIRLHPLVIIGSALGLLTFLFDPFSNLHTAYSAGKILLMFLSSCLLIPFPAVHERYFNLFHLNPPTWSLFWEYVVNVFYAFVLVKLRNKMMWVLLVIGGIALVYESARSTYLGVGWGGDNVWGGGIRVFYSFLAGILVYRSNYIIRSRLGFMGIGILLFLVFLIPFSVKTNWITDPAVVILYFPFLIALGAGAQVGQKLKGICKFLGYISYPLYMIHYPFLWIFLSYVDLKKPGMAQMEVIIPIGVVLLIGLAYVIMRFVDAPLRSYLGAQNKSTNKKPLSVVKDE